MLINNAFAQAATSATESSPLMSFVPLILIFVIFYVLIIRPQSKKMKEHQNIVNNLKVGNKIITNSGIIGIVKGINDSEGQLEIEIADGVVIKMLKNHVLELVKKEEILPKDKKNK